MSDFPFDRVHVHVDVSFPVTHLGRREELEAVVGSMAGARGGTIAMTSRPAPEFLGAAPGQTFGFAVAFEAGDVNADGFASSVRRHLAEDGVIVAFDPEDVIHPCDEPAFGS